MLYVTQRFIGAKAVDRQRRLVMTGPISGTPATAIDKKLADAVRANRGDGHRASHHDTCGFVATHLYRFQWGNFHTQDNEHSDIRIYDRDLLGRRFGADGRR